MGQIRVGTSGWRYARWRGDFYPRGLVQRRELEYIASRMSSVELNGTFYSLQRPSTYARIAAETPDDFVVAVKGSRFITHLRQLRDVEVPLANFLASGLLALGPKLGPILWQLPPSLAYDEWVARAFLGLLPRTTEELANLARLHDDRLAQSQVVLTPAVRRPVCHALEVRHPSWLAEPALHLLRSYDVGLVVADSPGRWPCSEVRTSSLRYVRLHGHSELYASGYSSRSLDGWATRCRLWAAEGDDVFVYFDNDARGRAPHDASSLLRRLAPAGAEAHSA